MWSEQKTPKYEFDHNMAENTLLFLCSLPLLESTVCFFGELSFECSQTSNGEQDKTLVFIDSLRFRGGTALNREVAKEVWCG